MEHGANMQPKYNQKYGTTWSKKWNDQLLMYEGEPKSSGILLDFGRLKIKRC